MLWKRLISNSTDDNRCYQACIQMIYESFFEYIDNNTIDTKTGYEDGKWTWPFQGFKFLVESGLDVLYTDRFDPKIFIEDPIAWLNSNYPQNEAKLILEKSDIVNSARSLKLILECENFVHNSVSPNVDQIKHELESGGRVIVGINSRYLNGKNGYAGHFVLVNNIEKEIISITDPGLPAKFDRKIDKDTFLKAWHYPTSGSGWLASIKET